LREVQRLILECPNKKSWLIIFSQPFYIDKSI
jgi:hypothetical protein